VQSEVLRTRCWFRYPTTHLTLLLKCVKYLKTSLQNVFKNCPSHHHIWSTRIGESSNHDGRPSKHNETRVQLILGASISAFLGLVLSSQTSTALLPPRLEHVLMKARLEDGKPRVLQRHLHYWSHACRALGRVGINAAIEQCERILLCILLSAVASVWRKPSWLGFGTPSPSLCPCFRSFGSLLRSKGGMC
jgi:hypothetical protein